MVTELIVIVSEIFFFLITEDSNYYSSYYYYSVWLIKQEVVYLLRFFQIYFSYETCRRDEG